MHEAIHGQLLPQRRLKESVARVLAIAYLLPFDAVRFGHLMHHRFTREPYDRPRVWQGVLMSHHLHQLHHRHPTLPWTALPALEREIAASSPTVADAAYFRTAAAVSSIRKGALNGAGSRRRALASYPRRHTLESERKSKQPTGTALRIGSDKACLTAESDPAFHSG